MDTGMKSMISVGLPTVGIFLVAFASLFLCMDRAINVYDEGLVLTAAMRVSAGDVPHRDFYVNYGPAEFYLLSWLFDWFGPKVMVERVFDLAVRAWIVSLVYLSLVSHCKKSVAILIIVISALWLISVGNHGYPLYPTLLLALLSSLLMMRFLTGKPSAWLPLIAGLLTGLAALFRYDSGFFLFVANILSALVVYYSRDGYKIRLMDFFCKNLTIYVVASAIPVIGILIWYWQIGAIDSFFHDIVMFSSQYYARTRSLPFPSIISWSSGAVYFPVILIYTVFLLDFKKLKNGDGKDIFIIVFSTLTMLFYLKGCVRVSPEHMQLALMPALLVLGVMIEIAVRETWVRPVAAALIILTSVSACHYGVVKLHYRLVFKDTSGFYDALASGLDNVNAKNRQAEAKSNQVSGLAFLVPENRILASRYIAANTNSDDKLFAGLTRHDKIFINDISSYFLTRRMPATKWHQFDPGLQTSAEIQTEMVHELERNQPPYVWLESSWDDNNEPNDSVKSSGVTLLDDYIRKEYIPVQNFGSMISVWKLKRID